VGTVYEDEGVTVDEGSTLISTESTVDDTTFGTYTVTYTATDQVNPDTTVSRVVRVGLPPDVTVNGANPFNLEKFDVFVDPGITINDSNSSLISTTSTVNNIVVGTYTVNYTVSNPVFTDVFSRTVRVRDTTPPVITIAGDNPYTLERFSVYTDPGATVDIGSELTNTNLDAVQNTAIGSFDVVYTAYDGNTTVTATRTVNVVDTVPPVITIQGDNPYTLERFDVYMDDGATVDRGSILTTNLTAVDNTLTHGSSFLVTYTATDGNVAHDVTQTRTVNIVDTKPPEITLLGDNPYEIQPQIPFQDVDPGFEVDLGTSVTVDYSNVLTTDNSNFDVIYTASDGVNPDTVVTRRVEVADTLSPIITILGDNPITLERYDVYNDEGVTLDPGSFLVSTVSTVDNTEVGSYTVTYVSTDNINPDTTERRIVNVVDTTAPIVTLNGASSIILERYDVFSEIDPGVTIDANGTLTSVDISQLDNTTQGTYTVTYNVVDDHNNANVITREVVVQDTVPPVVTLNNESTSYTLERYGDWSAIDPGVTIDAGSYLDSVTVDNTSVGLKVVTYTVKDGTNTTQRNRVITVVDTVAPVGSINNPSYQLERFGVYTEYGVTSLDAGTYLAGTDTTNVDSTLSPGSTFDVVYDLGDGTNNTYLTRTVTIVDTTPPSGTINNPSLTLERFSVYNDPVPGVINLDQGSYIAGVDLSNVDNTLSPGSTFDVIYDIGDGVNNTYLTRTVTIVDTTPPSGTINNPSSTLERFGVYNDPVPGVINLDQGSYIAGVDLSNVDNTLSPGSTFDVIYDVGDGVNNTYLTRTVTVVDTTPPSGTINNPSLTLERFGVYNDPVPGVINLDQGSYIAGVDLSNVDNTLSPGSTFDVIYDVGDGVNNTYLTRTVTIIDTTAPVITLVNGDEGTTNYTVERGTAYVDPGATADTGELVTVNTSELNMTVSGTYTVRYSATDADGNIGTASRTVIVDDTIAPVITLVNGDEGTTTYTVERGTTYIDPGATANGGETVTVDTSELNMAVSGTYTVTYSATDVDENTRTVSRTVIVEDTNAPVITPANGDEGTTNYTVERGTTYVDPGATADTGETVTVNTSQLNMSVSGTYTVTYSATDVDGNTGTASRTVIVEDTNAPVITLVNGDQGTTDYTVERGTTYVDPGATADTGETVTVNTTQLNMAVSGTYTVTYSATDVDGNTGTASRTVIVEDTNAPVITLVNGDIGTTNYTVERGTTYVDPGATADTGELVTVNTTQLNMSVSGTYTVTYSATDVDGNTGTASRTVIVEDTTDPVITLVNGDEGTTNYTVQRGTTYIDPGATADGGETVTVNTSQLNMSVSGTYTVTYSASDVDGNTGTASRTVIVEDTNAPVITLTNGDPGTTNYTVQRGTAYVDPGSTTDTGETITVNTSGLNMSVSGTYTVTYSATDLAGNTGTASRTVIVEDTNAPVITLNNGDPGTTNYTLQRGTNYIDPGATTDTGETVTVNTSQLNMSVSGTYTVTYSATDADGNTGTASRTVIIEDTIAPVITLVNGDEGTTDYTVQRGTTYVDPGATADTGETVTVNTSQLNMAVSGTYIVTYSATDVDGNTGTAFRYVIVEDTNAPVITLVNGDEGTTDYTVERGTTYVDPGATADTGETITVNTSQLNMAVSGTYTVTYSATDADGNTGTASRTVIVEDTNDPVITLVNGDEGTTDYTVERGTTYVDPGATADTGETVTVNTSGLNMAVSGDYTVTYSATDADDNTGTASRIVKVRDTTAPVITLVNGDEGTTDYTVERGTTYVDPGATADGGETVTVDTSGVNMSVSGDYEVTYTATDADDNIGTTSRIVKVRDTTAPVITLDNGDQGTTDYTVERGTTYIDPGATADGGETVTVDTSGLNMAVSDTYTVTYTATDADGNIGTASRTVIVEDNIAPVITLVNGDEGTTNYTVERGTTYIDPGATADTGETVTINTSQLNMAVSDTYTVTYSATDADGNIGTASRTVIVEDTTDPVITLIEPEKDPITVERYSAYIDPGATTSGDADIVVSSTVNTSIVDTYTVTYIATDADGNQSQASRGVTVVDTKLPVASLVGANSITVERFSVWEDVDPGLTDFDEGSYLDYVSGFDNTVVGVQLVTYHLSDGVNSNTITRAVTVEDTTAPVITLVNGDEGTPDYTVERGTTYVDPGATTDTGELVTINTSGLNMAVSGNYTVTYSATDADDNIGTAIRNVIVEDNFAPVITLVNGDPGTPDYTVERGTTYVDPGATTDTGELVTINTSGLNMAVSGNYTVTYSATDADDNIGTAIRNVIVEDNFAPVITLVNGDPGTPDYTVERGTTYVDPGATTDTGELVTINTSGLNMAVSGNYTVTYSATDADDNIGTAIRNVIVEDNFAPVITLVNGDEGTTDYTVERGTTYVDPGATADGGETVTVNTSQLNMAVSNTYTVTYSATDADGNIGTASRTVIVEDTTAPVITLTNGDPGTTTYTVEKGTTYVDPGASTDTGEPVTVNTSQLNMAVPETYTVTYSATDADGNTGTAFRYVIVEDTTAPVITLSGDNPYILEKDTTYVDPGATADGGETVTVDTSQVNMAFPDTYTVTYSASDAYGNIGTASRTVIVEHTEQFKLLAPDAAGGDRFGISAGISGDYAIVGANTNDDGGWDFSSSGSAYIFHRTAVTNTWDAGTKILAPDIAKGDQFGDSVAISGDYAIVGATLNDDGASSSGSAYIFRRTGTNTWDAGTKILAPDAAGGDRFGHSVGISGDYAIVGATYNDDGGTDSGSAYIFRRTDINTWDAGTKLTWGGFGYDQFGFSVGISGDYAIVGANGTDDRGSASGSAHIFRRTGTNTWDAGTKIRASDEAGGDFFGTSVAIDGDYAIVGADQNDDGGGSSGSAYIFRRTGTNTWDAGTKILAPDAAGGDFFGRSVAIDGNTAIVGADRNDDAGTSSGSAYIFRRTGTNTWDGGEKILASDDAAGDFFGYSVGISGNIAIVGAIAKNSYTGSAYIYDLT
jgi:hypothetical protein